MKKSIVALYLLLSSGLCLGAGPKNFVSGLLNSACFSLADALKGKDVKLQYPSGQQFPKTFSVHEGQANLGFTLKYGSGSKVWITTDLGTGYDKDGFEKSGNRYCVGQYDFDHDGVAELVVSVYDPDNDGFTGIGLNVFRYSPPMRVADTVHPENWRLIGKIAAHNILGEGAVLVKDSAITIPRNLRGFYYQLAWAGGKFVDASDY